MKLKNNTTGDVLELPPPDQFGRGSVILNGNMIATCRYSDEDGGRVRLGDGAEMTPREWSEYILSILNHTEDAAR